MDLAEPLAREVTASREARARYVTSNDAQTIALRTSMEEREATVLAELVRRHALSYAGGRIYTLAGVGLHPTEVFEEDSLEDWSDRLAAAVLEQAYPSLPFDHTAFPQTLTPETVAAIFRGLFQGDLEHERTAAAFGPPLGLTTHEVPSVFDARACRTVQVIQRDLSAHEARCLPRKSWTSCVGRLV